jgi:hypothetical protein
MTTMAVDMSNYTDPLTPANLQALKDAGVTHVIVQAIDPPPGYPVGKTRAQIEACLDACFTVDAYVWLWFAADVSDISRKLQLLDGLPLRQLWLDVEDTAAVRYSQAAVEAKVNAALQACDGFLTQVPRTGVYSGRWFWLDPRYMGNTAVFADRELWDANYDDVADAALGFVPYGGWAGARIKQFRGSTRVAGIGGLDLNVLAVLEEAEIAPPPGIDQGWLAKKSDVVGMAGELLEIADQLDTEAGAKPIARDQLHARATDVRTRAMRILA